MSEKYRLAADNRVRKESWGLLFYSMPRHRMFFVRSGDWLYPHHFDGSWTPESLVSDIAGRTGISNEAVERTLGNVIGSLTKNGLVFHELC